MSHLRHLPFPKVVKLYTAKSLEQIHSYWLICSLSPTWTLSLPRCLILPLFFADAQACPDLVFLFPCKSIQILPKFHGPSQMHSLHESNPAYCITFWNNHLVYIMFQIEIFTLWGSVQFSHSVMSGSLQPRELRHARLPCSSSTPGAYSNSYPLLWWCHSTVSFSVIPFSSCLQYQLTSYQLAIREWQCSQAWRGTRVSHGH